MNPQTYIGCAVTVILREGSYHGTIHRFDTVDKRITLKDVSNPVNGNKYPGIRHFYASEILEMVMDDDYDESLIDPPPCAVIKPEEAPAYEDASPIISKAYETPLSTNKSFIPDSPAATSCNRYTIIEEFNDQFQEAMTIIQRQKMIGFSLMSVGEGRQGKICWVAISVQSHAYLFDFLALGKFFFQNGLQDVLESKKIIKIIHDCRFISDLLFHKYSVNLTNVFDTQVADAFVHRTWYGAGQKNIWPKFVQQLSVSLFGHLKLTPEEIAGLNACEGRSKVEEGLWTQRPLSVSLAETLACCVKYLNELRALLIEKMMVEYVAGVDIYLNTVKNLPTAEVSWCAKKSEYLPKTFNQMNKFSQVVKDGFKNREREPLFSLSENHLESKSIQQLSPVSSKMHTISKSVPPSYRTPSPVTDPENTSFPSSPTLSENQSSLKTSPTNGEKEDILIQAARKMINSDIPSDLLDLLKTPVKSPPVQFDSKPTTLHDTGSAEHRDSHSAPTRIEWSKYRNDISNRTKLDLLPAGCNLSQTRKKKKTKPKQSDNSFQSNNPESLAQSIQSKFSHRFNNENKSPTHSVPFDDAQSKSDADDQITDKFFEIPDRESFSQDYSVLGQVQTYSVSPQPFHHRINNVNNFYSNDSNNNRTNPPPHIPTDLKSQISSSMKASHPRKTSIQESPSTHTESLSVHMKSPSAQMEKSSSVEVNPESENGTYRNYWVTGTGMVGNGSMTHIERLMAVWRNNCK